MDNQDARPDGYQGTRRASKDQPDWYGKRPAGYRGKHRR